MSRVGLKGIVIPSVIDINLCDHDRLVEIKKAGTVVSEYRLPSTFRYCFIGNFLYVLPLDVELADNVENLKQNIKAFFKVSTSNVDRGLWGLYRKELSNVIYGIVNGFTAKIELIGVGYKASVTDEYLDLFLGYAHLIKVLIPNGCSVNISKSNIITLSGSCKRILTAFASKIRALRPLEPYNGKGVRVNDEIVLRKEGKK